MRKYFEFNLKGRELFPYIFLFWVLMVGVGGFFGWKSYDAITTFSDPALTFGYFARRGGGIMSNFVVMTAQFLLLFFVLRLFVEGLSYGEERMETDYNFKSYAWLVVKGAFFSAITFGIYFPWFFTKMTRYFAENTSFRFNTFGFEGKAGTLFSLTVLFAVVPAMLALALTLGVIVPMFAMGSANALIWLVVLLVLVLVMEFFYLALVGRWFIDFSYGPKVITSTVKGWNAGWFLFGQLFLAIITMGLYLPMAMLRTYRYFVNRMVLGDVTVEDKFGFSLNVWSDYWFLLGQMLLSVLTVGIYLPWAYAKIATRLVTHTYVEVVGEQNIPMPARD